MKLDLFPDEFLIRLEGQHRQLLFKLCSEWNLAPNAVFEKLLECTMPKELLELVQKDPADYESFDSFKNS